MGEDSYPYAAGNVPAYPNTFQVKTEHSDVLPIMSYHLGNSDPYCTDPKIIASVAEKAYPDETIETYVNGAPQLQHVHTLSTTCTSESFHSSLPSADSTEISAFDIQYAEPQDFDWSINGTTTFQWPPNRTCPQTVVDNR